MIKTFLIFMSALIFQGNGIKFSYILQQRQMQCFHETACKMYIDAENGIRYQIDIKANSSLYSFEVNEGMSIHSDSGIDQEYKYFSAFAITDSGINFCVNNLSDDLIEMQIVFYHGFYLQAIESSKDSKQFLSMTRKMQEISNLIKMNYQKYKHQILEREPIINRIEIYSTFAIIIFLLIILTVKIVYLQKATKFMKHRKII